MTPNATTFLLIGPDPTGQTKATQEVLLPMVVCHCGMDRLALIHGGCYHHYHFLRHPVWQHGNQRMALFYHHFLRVRNLPHAAHQGMFFITYKCGSQVV